MVSGCLPCAAVPDDQNLKALANPAVALRTCHATSGPLTVARVLGVCCDDVSRSKECHGIAFFVLRTLESARDASQRTMLNFNCNGSQRALRAQEGWPIRT